MQEERQLQTYLETRDPHDFRVLVDRYQDMLWATCRRILHDTHEAEEAVHETFLSLSQKGAEVKSNLGAWLHACAVNHCLEQLRRLSKERKLQRVMEPGEKMDDPGSRLVAAELQHQVDLALGRLSAEDREILVRHYLQDQDQASIGKALGLSQGQVSRRIQNALERMRVILCNRGLALAGLLALHQGLTALEKPAPPAGMTEGLTKIGMAGNMKTAGPVGASWLAWVLVPAIVTGGLAGWWKLAHRGEDPTSPQQGPAGTEPAMSVSPVAQVPPTAQVQAWNWLAKGGLPYRIEDGQLRIGLRNRSSEKKEHLMISLGRTLPADSTITLRCLVKLPKASLICTFGLGIGSQKDLGAASWAVVVDRSQLTIKAEWDTDGFLTDLGVLYRLLGQASVPAQVVGNFRVDGGPHRFEIRHDSSGVHGSIDGVSLGTFVPEEGMGELTPCLTVVSAPGQDSGEEVQIGEVTIDLDGSTILSDFSTLSQRIP
jgi:RNA polymerase sigma factor (sigma-70 family)